jgi:hypothetical protein
LSHSQFPFCTVEHLPNAFLYTSPSINDPKEAVMSKIGGEWVGLLETLLRQIQRRDNS